MLFVSALISIAWGSSFLDGQVYSLEEFSRWFYTSHAKSKGAVLLIHGLNQRPSTLDEMASALNDGGYDVFRLALSGHRGSLDEFKEVSFASYAEEVTEARDEVAARARELGVPFYQVGFSLGAALELATHDETQPRAQILFAPPLSLRARSQFVRVFGILGASFVLPSLSPEDYRANSGTPMAGYAALFDALSTLRKSEKPIAVPTLAFADPDDEMIDEKASRERFARECAPGCQWKEVRGKIRHHLIIDESSLGKESWNEVKSQMLRFLDRSHGAQDGS